MLTPPLPSLTYTKQPERVINSSHLKQKFKAQRLPYKSHINHGLFHVIDWMNDWMMEADVCLGLMECVCGEMS